MICYPIYRRSGPIPSGYLPQFIKSKNKFGELNKTALPLFNSVRLFNYCKKLKVASKDRIQRLKDDTRANILGASIDIVKSEGWQALSMRRIAEKIEYTAPIIYEYFANKEAILN